MQDTRFELELGTPPPARQVGGAPAAGGQPAKVARRPERRAPPDEPRPGTNVLARLPEDAPPAATPAADVAAAPAATRPPRPAPTRPPRPPAPGPRSPEEIAAGSSTGDVVSQIVKSPDPEGAEP